MKKLALAILMAVATVNVFGQTQYSAESSMVTFFSWAPMEDIKAKNEAVKSLIRTSDDRIVIRIPIRSFIFPKSLMQEHFNENYLESDEFPNGSFAGNIIGDYDMEKDGVYKVTAKGELKIHGVEKPRELEGTLTVKDGKTTLDCKFNVMLEHHRIEIPTVVFQNIAEKIEVEVKIVYKAVIKK